MHHLAVNKHIFDKLLSISWLGPFVQFMYDGHLGVSVFFVISGFLITTLMLHEEANTNTISVKSFYKRRALRIFPAYYFLLIIYAILQLFSIIEITAASWLTSITYTKYFNWQLDWFTAHMWSLSVEEHFYILWPLIFLSGKNMRKLIAAIIIILVPLIRLYTFFHPVKWIDEFSLFIRIDAVALGCLFAMYKDEIISRMKNYWNQVFFTAVVCLFLLQYVHRIPADSGFKYIFIALGDTHGTLACFFISLIMMYSIFGPQNLWFRFLNTKALNFIGLISYSLYLWQQIFMTDSSHWMTRFPVNIVLIFSCATFSYFVVEKPFLKLKSRYSKNI